MVPVDEDKDWAMTLLMPATYLPDLKTVALGMVEQTRADALPTKGWESEGGAGGAHRASGSLMLINKEQTQQPGSPTSSPLLWPCLSWQHPAS